MILDVDDPETYRRAGLEPFEPFQVFDAYGHPIPKQFQLKYINTETGELRCIAYDAGGNVIVLNMPDTDWPEKLDGFEDYNKLSKYSRPLKTIGVATATTYTHAPLTVKRIYATETINEISPAK